MITDEELLQLLKDKDNKAEYRRVMGLKDRHGHFEVDHVTKKIKWFPLTINRPIKTHGIMRVVNPGGKITVFRLCACCGENEKCA